VQLGYQQYGLDEAPLVGVASLAASSDRSIDPQPERFAQVVGEHQALRNVFISTRTGTLPTVVEIRFFNCGHSPLPGSSVHFDSQAKRS
jgi:hypothetical protein